MMFDKNFRKTALILGISIVLLMMANTLSAGTTGKISGVVTDAETGEPLPGVNIILEGTVRGAATDTQGYYNILTVSPGQYTLKFSMMGYKIALIEEVRVRIDLTTTIHVELEQTVLETEETVTIVAERPLVQMDMTSSLATVSSEEIEISPAQSVQGMLSLQAGVVESGGIHIRGGRSSEVAYWVDGVAVTDVFDGGMGISVDQFSVQELQVVSGTFNAEYGKAMSGIVNIITKEGGTKYEGQIRGYFGDYMSNSSLYNVLNGVDVAVDPATGNLQAVERSENPLSKLNPTYNTNFTFSGPVPFTKNKVTFFSSGRMNGREGYLYGRNWFTPQGLPGDSALVPLNPNEGKSGQLKLTYRSQSNLKFNYSLLYNDSYSERNYSRMYRYNPGGIGSWRSKSMSQTLSMNHLLSETTFYELKLSRFYSAGKWRLHEDYTTRPHWLVRVGEGSGYVIDIDTAEGQEEFDTIKELGLPFSYFVDPENSDGYVHPDSSRDPASYSFWRAGNDLSRFAQSTSYWVGKFDLTSQIVSNHQLKLGAELILHELTLDDYVLRAKLADDRDEQIVPFVPDIPPISTVYHDQYTRNPREFSAYLQDKIELKDMVMNIGIRFDYFDANSNIPVNPRDPNIYDPFLDENIYKNPNDPEDQKIEYTSEERRAFMQKKVKAKTQISPRLGIAYPITDQGMIHFSYGHFFQMPEFQYLYDVPEFKLFSGGGRSIVGNPNLNAQRTVQYEIGFSQALTQKIGIDLTLFYRDIRDWVGSGPPIETVREVVSYAMFENKDYSNVRGITFKLDKRLSSNWSAQVDYSYQVVEGTYSNPTDAFNALLAQQEPRLNLIPLNWDQRQLLNVQLSYMVKGWIASFIGKYNSGEPYTPVFARGSRVGGAALSGLVTNSSRKPDVHSYDIHLIKRVKLGSLNFSFFLYGYNIFDQREERGVYSDTGTASYTTDPSPGEMPYDPNRIGTVEHLLLRPEWYIAPRQIQVGMSLNF